MSGPEALPTELIAEGARMARICNACRYCEGYCAVFPALERRLDFTAGDLSYLANLCHNCGSCYYACQYAPPHEFALNLPRMLAEIRGASYQRYAWPDAFASLFDRNGVAVSVAIAAMVALFLIGTGSLAGGKSFFAPHSDASGAFYALMPHSVMAWTFGMVFLLAMIVLAIGGRRFWRDTEERSRDLLAAPSLADATRDVLTLKYLDGGGEGCTYPDERPSKLRRTFHHFTFYGFMLCFAATCIATLYHYVLHAPAPYPFTSLPVLLGSAGGIGLVIGPVGLMWLKVKRDRELSTPSQTGMNAAFLVLLVLVSITGLALLACRETAMMGVLLAVHLGTVMALFLTLPYGKFVHGVYRFLALARYHLERRRPLPDIAAE